MISLPFAIPPAVGLLAIVWLILPFVVSYWVYTDAKKRGNDNAALWAIGVGVLTITTFFGGILALVVYIWSRN
jgi:hypothetical protein